MKILVVDDSAVMRKIVVRTLRQAGYGDHEVIEAENGAAALEQAEAACPGLVLSDWNMPVMTGIDLLRTLRSSGNEVPFGFVTSEWTSEMVGQASASGARFLIAKPFTPEQFRDQLDTVLS